MSTLRGGSAVRAVPPSPTLPSVNTLQSIFNRATLLDLSSKRAVTEHLTRPRDHRDIAVRDPFHSDCWGVTGARGPRPRAPLPAPGLRLGNSQRPEQSAVGSQPRTSRRHAQAGGAALRLFVSRTMSANGTQSLYIAVRRLCQMYDRSIRLRESRRPRGSKELALVETGLDFIMCHIRTAPR